MTEFRVSARLALTLRKDAERFGLGIEDFLWALRNAAGLASPEPLASRKAPKLRLVTDNKESA